MPARSLLLRTAAGVAALGGLAAAGYLPTTAGAAGVRPAAASPAAAAAPSPARSPAPVLPDSSTGRASTAAASATASASGGTGAAPTPARVLPDVLYGSDGGPLEMDVYLPAGSGPSHPVPVVVVLHGGGWAGGSRSDMTPEAQALSAAGLAVLNVDYRLSAPGQPGFPHQVADAGLALDWARSNAAVLGIDPGRVGALGASSGANLALELGVRGLVSAVVSWSAPTDLAAFETPAARCTTPSCGPLSLPYAAYQYLGCMPEACPGSYAAASPADQRSPAGVRYLVWNSSEELVPLSQAQEFVSFQRAAGVSVGEEVLPGHDHAAQYAGTALSPSVAFLVSSLGAPTAA